jgi:hypothetical protein
LCENPEQSGQMETAQETTPVQEKPTSRLNSLVLILLPPADTRCDVCPIAWDVWLFTRFREGCTAMASHLN